KVERAMTSQTQTEAAISADAMIKLQGVEKWYGSFKALTNINLTVNSGEKIVLCGPSGSGKSTLIRCINRLEAYQAGKITVSGIELNDNGKAVDAVRRD